MSLKNRFMMKKSAILVASVLLTATSANVVANDENGKCYVKSSSSEILKNRYGECWNTGTDKSADIAECGGEAKPAPKPVVVEKVAHGHDHKHMHDHSGGDMHDHKHAHDHEHEKGDMAGHDSSQGHAHDHDGAANHGHEHAMATRSVKPAFVMPETITIASGALFDFDSAKLTANAKSAIDAELGKVDGNSTLTGNVKVIGHTDSLGAESYNQMLSEKRAQAVASYLESHSKITDKDISAVGKGESDPVASNDTRDSRALNRRVEIIFTR